jgi:hypothetical protein
LLALAGLDGVLQLWQPVLNWGLVGPILITGLLQAIGGWTWGVLAVVFTAAGLPAPRIAREPVRAEPAPARWSVRPSPR